MNIYRAAMLLKDMSRVGQDPESIGSELAWLMKQKLVVMDDAYQFAVTPAGHAWLKDRVDG